MKKKLIVCADDYAQSEAISEGIRRGVLAKRINAVSCLTTGSNWDMAGTALRFIRADCLVGLHLNLTFGRALSARWCLHQGPFFKGLALLLSACYLGRIDALAVQEECRAQLDAFRRVMGSEPDFIDGHQHVHQFPFVREALQVVYQNEKLTSSVRVTVGGSRMIGFPKAQLIACLGGMTLKRAMIRLGIPVNASFSGVYPFRQASHYRRYFKQFLRVSKDQGLIMCHPGLESKDEADPLHASRYHELAYLMSDAYLQDLEEHSVELFRGKEGGGCC